MFSIAQIAYLIGGILLVVHVFALAKPTFCHECLVTFPRNVWFGRMLAAVDIAWVTYVVAHASLGPVEFLKPWVYVAGPVAYILIVLFLEEPGGQIAETLPDGTVQLIDVK